ncbi:MAG: gfo/Idh/MocA family oxidoreductase, partial [Acidobacteria bacterium]|nr:gfo/Idh/MocA family oxidoreductase [Acidobacteriota bacterium]
FKEVEEMAAVTMRFPGERLATFICSFGGATVMSYRVIGTKGDLHMEPAYPYGTAIEYELNAGGEKRKQRYPKRDQFAAQLIYFSNCILENEEPQPSGLEGLIDVKIIEALYESAASGRSVSLGLPHPRSRPSIEQEISRPPVRNPPEPFNTESPAR